MGLTVNLVNRMRHLSCASRITKEIRLVVRISGDHLSLEGLRRALYNFLFARANNGKFILQLGLNKHGRQPRGKKIEMVLDRFGLERDEGPGTGGPFAPYSIAKRLKTYADVVERLIDTGLAYRCFCCGDKWKEMDPLKKEPAKLISCSGNVSGKHGELSKRLPATDQLLLRPDFMPTSFFADAVDNYTLCASHYVSSSSRDFLQLPICDALQWYLPTFINIGSLRLRSGSPGRGLRKTSDKSSRLYSIDEMIAQFDITTIDSNTLLINTYKLMKPERQETLLEEQLELDEEALMHSTNNYRLREFLKKVRNSYVDYDDYWIENLMKALPKDNETNDALIESLKFGTDKLSNQSNFYFIHLSLIKEIISNGDKNLWDCDFIKNFVRQLLRNATFDGLVVVMNALFMLYCELEERGFPYEDEEVVQKALQLLNNSMDSSLKITICNYLDKIFERKYNTCWAFAIAELLKTSSSRLLHKCTGNSEWRKRTVTRNFYVGKNLENRIEHISECEIVSMNFHFCKLVAELVGRTELIKIVWNTPNLRLLDLVELGYHSDEDYLNRGLSILCEERNALAACKFIASLENPSIDVLDSLYNTLELHNMINSMILNALLQKSEAWNSKIIPVLASKAAEQLNFSKWECRDNALNQLIVLVKYGYNGCVDVRNLAAYVVLSDSDSAPRIEAVQILHNGLPQTEKLCLDVIPKILYNEDIVLHRTVIDLCADLIINGRNEELRNLLIEFFEQDEVDCYEQLNEILYGKNKTLKCKDNGDLEYIFNVLAKQDEEDLDKDCYDL
ncbi:hypothetical protein DINM_004672 [Dirofilaria immitis]|nr:hypothetical protein [Dirofilaria immitis]